MVSARWSSLTDCSQLTSWLSEYAWSSTVRITSTCPLPKMLPDRALAHHDRPYFNYLSLPAMF
jgi:hypothetical protein